MTGFLHFGQFGSSAEIATSQHSVNMVEFVLYGRRGIIFTGLSLLFFSQAVSVLYLALWLANIL
jgi:hypothetical protein